VTLELDLLYYNLHIYMIFYATSHVLVPRTRCFVISQSHAQVKNRKREEQCDMISRVTSGQLTSETRLCSSSPSRNLLNSVINALTRASTSDTQPLERQKHKTVVRLSVCFSIIQTCSLAEARSPSTTREEQEQGQGHKGIPFDNDFTSWTLNYPFNPMN
jgi:hypothetical protein